MMSKQDSRQNVSSWSDLVWVHGLTLLLILLIFLSGCGFGVGNPEDDVASGLNTEFSGDEVENLVEDYVSASGIDCGRFDESSSEQELKSGRACIRSALASCQDARFLYEETEENLFISFVRVNGCLLQIHAISDDSSRFVGERSASCSVLEEDELVELACEIAN